MNGFLTNAKLKEEDFLRQMEDLFFEQYKIGDKTHMYPNLKLFRYLRSVDNLHDFDTNTVKTNGINFNKIGKDSLTTLQIKFLDHFFKTTKKDGNEPRVFLTVYLLIRMFGKILEKIGQITTEEYKILKRYIRYSTGSGTECLVDNGAKLKDKEDIHKEILPLLNQNDGQDGKNRAEIERDFVNATFQNEETHILNDLNLIKCREIVLSPLPKVMDGTGSIDDINFTEFNLPRYLVYPLIDLPQPPSLIKKKKILSVKGVYKKIEENPSLVIKKLDTDDILIKIIKTKEPKSKFGEDVITTEDGLIINFDKYITIEELKISDKVKYDKKELGRMLKNLGDVGMAYWASSHKASFRSTDKIAKAYYLVFNFYLWYSRTFRGRLSYLVNSETISNEEHYKTTENGKIKNFGQLVYS